MAIQYAYDSNVAAGALTLSGGITFNSTSTLDAVRSGGLIDVTGAISGGGGLNIASSASSGGVVRLSAANTYTGATSVTSGVLAVNGSLASISTTVGTGATLQGSGSIAGSVTVQSGGTLATGNSIESLATGALSLLANSTFAYEINNEVAAGAAGDLTAVTGNLTLDLTNAAILTITELGSDSWSLGEKLTLISYTGTWNDGLFSYVGNTLNDDSTFAFSGAQWSFNYNDTVAGDNFTGDLTSGSFVTMTVIPEPNFAALIGGFGVLLIFRRRR